MKDPNFREGENSMSGDRNETKKQTPCAGLFAILSGRRTRGGRAELSRLLSA